MTERRFSVNHRLTRNRRLSVIRLWLADLRREPRFKKLMERVKKEYHNFDARVFSS